MTSNEYTTQDPELLASIALVADGTAYFEHALAALTDAELDGPSLLPGWTRRHVIAHTGYNALGLLRLAQWAATGVETPMYASIEQRNSEIDSGAALPADEVRALFVRTADELDAGWRGMDDAAWASEVRMSRGSPMTASTTVWLRTREVWLHAVDLNGSASCDDFPADLVDHVLANVLSAWRGRQAEETIPNFVLAATDRDAPKSVGDAGDPNAIVLAGTAADLLHWATGRGAQDVTTANGEPVPAAPRWI
jgi:maleylpyruvate isomerase